MKKNVFITGANGFIGKNLIEKLKDKYHLLTPLRAELDLLDGEKVDNYFDKNPIDIVIHAANYDTAPKNSTKDPNKVLENNLRMFFNIIKNEKKYKKMIYFGSGAEFDREHWVPKMKEKYFGKHIPHDQYGLSKFIMTKYALKSKKIINLRLFGVYGKYENYLVRVISNMCFEVIKSKTINLRQNRMFDFLFVDDLVKIVDFFIKNKFKSNTFNVCSGEVVDFLTIAKEIEKISRNKININLKNQEIIGEYSGDNTKLLEKIGNFKFTPWKIGVSNLFFFLKRRNYN